jgi:hypothetical protein
MTGGCTRFVRLSSVVSLMTMCSVAGIDARQVGSARSSEQAGPATTHTATVQGQQPWRGRAAPQGFSVVLVLGDFQAAGAEDDVPPAARKALADMRDFLPYKSYKLLDAAWILCCGSGRTVSRLRGPDDREYEIEITSSNSEMNRAFVQFLLRDAEMGARTPEPVHRSEEVEKSRRIEVQSEMRTLERQLTALKAQRVKEPSRADVAQKIDEIEDRLRVLRAIGDEIEQSNAGNRVAAARAAAARNAPRPIMNTSFHMDIGETVVVGTSRLSGNSKALIALLTAVPQRAGVRRD